MRSVDDSRRPAVALRVAAIAASVVLHALAFPPWNQSWLSWFALVPFLLGLRGLRPRHGFALGWLWGTLAIWVVAYWVPAGLRFYYQQEWWFVILFCVVGSQILWGTYYALFGAVACRIMQRRSGVGRVALLAAAWAAAELGRARLLTGEPWMLLGYGLVPNLHLIQIADLGGVYALSFVVLFVNAALAEAVAATGWLPTLSANGQEQRPQEVARADARNSNRHFERGFRQPAVVTALVLVSAAWVYGEWRLRQEMTSPQKSQVAIIQGNIAVGSQWRAELYAKGLQEYLDASRAAATGLRPDLIVWPESAITFFLSEEAEFLAAIKSMIAESGAELIVGGPHVDHRDVALPSYFNSAFYVTAAGIQGRYDKGHLLPFGEYFPLKTIEFLRRRFERVRTFTPGDGTTLLATRAGTMAVVICFEALFPELVRAQMARGAQILVNLSNDVWLGDNAGPRQHASMVTLRAVENRTWVIRATTTGVSAIIDPHGRVVAESPIDTAAVLDGQVAALSISSFYKSYGDVFGFACVLVAVVFLIAAKANETTGTRPIDNNGL